MDDPCVDAVQTLLLLVLAFTAAGRGKKAYMLMGTYVPVPAVPPVLTNLKRMLLVWLLLLSSTVRWTRRLVSLLLRGK